jgi:class III poly(R)-hydroxyalkanoic acid synthase PhaE subunit
MTDRAAHDGDWIAAWIARQREALEQAARARNSEEQAADLGRRWGEVGQAFLDGLRQFAGASGSESGAGPDPFNIHDALLGAWTTATMFHSSVAEQAAELLRRLPPVGIAREQAEAWRELASAQAECRRLEHELRSVLTKVQFDALDLLEKRVRERDPQQPIGSFRELYDLWVECGEQVYGELAHSPAYSKLQAELGNAAMRLRIRVQTVLEHGLKQLDLPTRSELNSLHRQVRELRLELERMRERSDGNRRRTPAESATKRKATQVRRATPRKTRSKARAR